MNKSTFAALLLVLAALPAAAKVDLVTLPARDRVELTIYNGADLTLVRESRTLTMRKGLNRLQFSWAGTLIDPTSLELTPVGSDSGAQIRSIEYPPNVTGLGIWTVDSERAGKTPFEITSFTSGLSWSALYQAVLSPEGDRMRLEGYVRVDNSSGEDFEGAKTRIVVGRVNLIDQVAELAGRQNPYGRPEEEPVAADMGYRRDFAMSAPPPMAAGKALMMEMRPKEIVKEALSEYFLYSIEGVEDVRSGWGKRLSSFSAPEVGIENLYRFDEAAYGAAPVRFISFTNDAAHGLGREPLPDGVVSVFAGAGKAGGLSYVGREPTRYVPVGGEVNLNLGPSNLVTVKPTVMDYSTDSYEWRRDEITGFDEHRVVKVEVFNGTAHPATVEVRRTFETPRWELKTEGESGNFKKIDSDTVQYTLTLEPNSKKTFTYRVDLKFGSRAL